MTTREKILETAFQQFSELGYEKASLSLIASQVGISKPALYHHFASKEELFEALYDVIISEIIKDFNTDMDNWNAEEYADKLESLGSEEIAYLKSHPQLGKILKQYYLLALRNERLEQKTMYLEERTFGYHRRIVDRGVALGFFKQEETAAVTEMFNAQLNGISWGIISRPSGSFEAAWQAFIKHLIQK